MEGKLKKIAALIMFLTLTGCATAPTGAPTENNYVAGFNYTPPAQTKPLSSNVTFTVANASFKTAGNLAWITFPQFARLPDALRQNLTDILVAKGFGVRGPYDSYDLIPFQDKKDIDLYASILFEPSIALKDQKEGLENYWGWQSPTLQTGNAEVTGTVKLELREIATRELMWAKNIPINKIEFPYVVRIPWGKAYKPGKIYNYGPIVEGMAKGLEQQYPDIMATVYSLIDPEEMLIIKKQAQELKSKKGY